MLRSALINVMVAAARKAARSLKRDFGEVEHLQVSVKGPANFVTAADRRAEETLRAIPQFCISIGLERSGTVVAGVVYNPITDELFVAERQVAAPVVRQRAG